MMVACGGRREYIEFFWIFSEVYKLILCWLNRDPMLQCPFLGFVIALTVEASGPQKIRNTAQITLADW